MWSKSLLPQVQRKERLFDATAAFQSGSSTFGSELLTPLWHRQWASLLWHTVSICYLNMGMKLKPCPLCLCELTFMAAGRRPCLVLQPTSYPSE